MWSVSCGRWKSLEGFKQRSNVFRILGCMDDWIYLWVRTNHWPDNCSSVPKVLLGREWEWLRASPFPHSAQLTYGTVTWLNSTFFLWGSLSPLHFPVLEQQGQSLPPAAADDIQPDRVAVPNPIWNTPQGWAGRAQEEGHSQNWSWEQVSYGWLPWELVQRWTHNLPWAFDLGVAQE